MPIARGVAEFARPTYRRCFPWTGLDGLDRKILPMLPKRPGVFIEAGANDGIQQSNTHGLERSWGWSGILVEPIPSLAARCACNRPSSHVVNAALVAPEREGAMVDIIDLGLMSLVPELRGVNDVERHIRAARTTGARPHMTTVRGQTLSRVIDESRYTSIDFLSLDVEGYELPALAGLDIARHAPLIVLVETIDIAAVSAALGPRYRIPISLTAHDTVWLREDWSPDNAEAFGMQTAI